VVSVLQTLQFHGSVEGGKLGIQCDCLFLALVGVLGGILAQHAFQVHAQYEIQVHPSKPRVPLSLSGRILD
jgi:hypothetical protein